MHVYVRPYLCYLCGEMTVAEEIKVAEDVEKLSRDWAAVEQGGDDAVRDLNNKREEIIEFRKTVQALYNAAELLTSNFKSTALAVATWKELHNKYTLVLNRFAKLPKVEPGIDGAIDDLCKVLRDWKLSPTRSTGLTARRDTY